MNVVTLLAARYLIIAYAGVFTFMLFPLLIVLFSNLLAMLSKCPAGVQISNQVCTNGDIIYGLSQAGWLLVFTLPLGILFLIGIIFLHAFLYLVIKKKEVVIGYALNKIRKKILK